MPDQWTCNECGDTFNRREHHQRHLRTHTKEKPFACSVCGSDFGRIDSLARHHASTHLQTTAMGSSEHSERQRVSRACKRCSTAKVKCDGKRPCEKCASADSECLYESPKRRRTASQRPTIEPQPKRHFSEAQASCAGRNVSAPGPSPAEDQPEFMPAIDPQLCIIPPVRTVDATIPDFMHLDFFAAPKTFGCHDDLSNMDWLSDGLDVALWPAPFDLQAEAQLLQDIDRIDVVPPMTHKAPSHNLGPYLPPTPASDLAELYSRSHTPVMDKDAVDIRQYHPTSIEVDAPLSWPEIDPQSLVDADLEDFAHVESLSQEKVDAVAGLIDDVQNKPHYPLFNSPKLPARSIINAWVQLYFEYFHPVFPVLHKATFSSLETPPLLVLVVAAIGAQFSDLPNSLACARSLHELVRRLSSRQCEFQNKNGRTVWMTQVVMLNSLAMSHSGERRALEVSEILQAVPVALARRKGLLEDVLTHERILQMQAPLQQTWRLWAMDEERRRTGFGVWLVDFAFQSDFNLTTVMNSHELKNSLPQSDARWNANSAQSWASYPPGLGSGRTKSLAEVVSTDSWLSTWSKTSTLGKQVILQDLMERVRLSNANFQPSGQVIADSAHAKRCLESFLSALNEQQDISVDDLKASMVHKAICLTALMIGSSPGVDVTKVALSRIYRQMTDEELSHMSQAWREAPHQGREAVFHAGYLFETIRNSHSMHYSMPSYLLRAVLTLWLYSVLFDKPEVTGFTIEPGDSGSITLGTARTDNDRAWSWINQGHVRIKLPSIANLLCRLGRRKLLEHSIAAMGSLRSWGISRGYLQLLKRLEASESVSAPK
ncbi:fungal-specific transcription factor domain-containing protein [Boeremia exigua]|uniref:fungal-specific transcription factor domain-containing protein n=1 Tax=Boeremia exigua TaxID=749465 RepID=UPI001E8D744A|nr:fungal-specific transcription factor domain-containing protein [Boeremia exigua]KAH6618441.1 fungal-specific transcription factor domain-containing protein [Boeremia exigua]